MSIFVTYDELHRIVLAEFAEIFVHADIQRLPTGDPRKLRLFLVDNFY